MNEYLDTSIDLDYRDVISAMNDLSSCRPASLPIDLSPMAGVKLRLHQSSRESPCGPECKSSDTIRAKR